MQQLVALGRLEIGAQLLLDADSELEGLVQEPVPARREDHRVGPPVGRVRAPSHEPFSLQLVDQGHQERGEHAAEAIASAAGHARVAFIQVDHSTVGANSQLGETVTARLGRLGLGPRLDVLVNNVGGIFATRTVTPDGYEATLAVNFLAPVVVTHSVLPLPHASGSPRCVNVTSSLAWLARQLPDGLLTDPQSTRDYVGIRAYARTKLLTAAWTIALGRQQARSGLVTATVNPGMAWTAMTQALTPQVVPSWRYVYPLVRFFQKRGDPARAARVCAELAWTASPAEISGQYITERSKPGRCPAALTDPAVQDQVISTAEKLARYAPTAAGPPCCPDPDG